MKSLQYRGVFYQLLLFRDGCFFRREYAISPENMAITPETVDAFSVCYIDDVIMWK